MKHADRVREATSAQVNRRIDHTMEENLSLYAQGDPGNITLRLRELDREWDIERVLETYASGVGLTGLTLGVVHDRRWLALSGLVLSFVLQHALQGWCLPVPVLRRLGVRTRREIDEERYALKALRGDFNAPDVSASAQAALQAVRG